MADREKVIKGLEMCIANVGCDGCPYEDECYSQDRCEQFSEPMMCDALALLKEQKAVKPKYNARTNWYECGNCHYSMTSGMHCRSELIPATKVRYCANCGFPVNWEGW